MDVYPYILIHLTHQIQIHTFSILICPDKKTPYFFSELTFVNPNFFRRKLTVPRHIYLNVAWTHFETPDPVGR